MKFFRRLRAAWLFFRSEPYLDVRSDYWTPEDAAHHSLYMTSPTGKKLAVLFNNRVVTSARDATLKTSNQYDQGYAGGCRGTIAFMDSLLTVSPSEAHSEQSEVSALQAEVDYLASLEA